MTGKKTSLSGRQDDAIQWPAEEFPLQKHLQPRRYSGHGANRTFVTSKHSHLTDIRWACTKNRVRGSYQRGMVLTTRPCRAGTRPPGVRIVEGVASGPQTLLTWCVVFLLDLARELLSHITIPFRELTTIRKQSAHAVMTWKLITYRLNCPVQGQVLFLINRSRDRWSTLTKASSW